MERHGARSYPSVAWAASALGLPTLLVSRHAGLVVVASHSYGGLEPKAANAKRVALVGAGMSRFVTR
jgi:hypothetical protein